MGEAVGAERADADAEAGGRDRYVDLVRAGSIVAVVAGHWLIADLDWDGELERGGSALGVWPWLWPLTWLLQVMGLFFFVGGFSNRRSWESGRQRQEGYAAFVDRRLHRLVVPTGLFLAVLVLVGLLMTVFDRPLPDIGAMLTQPLWFLGVYVLIVALTPATLALHHRWDWRVLPVAAAAVVVLDLVRVAAEFEAPSYLNVLFVWGVAHQLGYFWGEGRISSRVAAAMAVGGLAATVVLTAFGPYPARMVGVRGDELVNSHPPTLALGALAIAQIGVIVLLSGWGRRALRRERLWRLVIAVNLMVMTIYVWHETALALAARIGFPLGLPHPTVGDTGWFAARVLLIVVAALVLAAIVATFGRVEAGLRPPPVTPDGAATTAAAIVAVILVALGMLGLAATRVLDPLQRVIVLDWVGVPAIAPVLLLAGGVGVLAVARRTRAV